MSQLFYPRERIIFRLMLDAGLRESEVVNLERDEVFSVAGEKRRLSAGIRIVSIKAIVPGGFIRKTVIILI